VAEDTVVSDSTTERASAPQAGARDERWQDLEFAGNLDIEQAVLFRLHARNLALRSELHQGRLTLTFSSPDFYAGRINGYLELDALGTQAPELQLLAKAENLSVAPLLQDLRSQMALDGIAEIGLDLTAPNGDRAPLRERLAGELSLLLRDVTLEHELLASLLKTTGVTLGQADLPPLDAFSAISATFKGADGRFRSDDLMAQSQAALISGTGVVDLPEQEVDFDLTAILQETPNGHGIAELNGLPMPVRVSGDWQAPDIHLNPGPALREAARRALDNKLREHGDDLRALEKRLGVEGLEQGLKALLGRD
jgi:AsmA protein